MKWTDDDIKRAAQEGWKLQNGYIAQAYDASGLCPFPTVADVVEFLRIKGKESEWHKEVYVSIPWTLVDSRMAVSEGWYLALGSIHTLSPVFFETDDAARECVVARAQAGDPLHIKALSIMAKRRLIHGGQ
jgi:hypothetical protein